MGYKKGANISNNRRYPLLCFDTETTNHGEILELSIFDIDGNEIFHQYFKPRAKKWPTDIHHITPEMVEDKKRFAAYRDTIQRLINSTDFLLGCAIMNDINTLRRYGVNISRRHRVIDIQNWFWLLNDTSFRVEKRQTGLASIAGNYGLTFQEGEAHSATADTKMTLKCFKSLVLHFTHDFPSNALKAMPVAWRNLPILNQQFNVAYEKALQEHRMKGLAGFINVVKRDKGFSFKYSRFEPTGAGKDKVVMSVYVNDRVAAEHDMRMRFAPVQLKGLTGIFDLTENDFEYISSYKNFIDLEMFAEREAGTGKKKDEKSRRRIMRTAKKLLND